MSLKTVLVAAILAVGFAGAAEARNNGTTFTAQLATPVAARTQVIADNTLWSCEADTCRAVVRNESSVRACRQLAREAGTIVSYGTPEASLSSEELTRCNSTTTTARTTTSTAAAQ